MHRKFIALVLSAALAVTSLNAQPAHAGSDDTAKWVAALAALAIVGVAINENKKKKRKKRHVTPVRPHDPYLLPGRCRVTRNLQGNTIRGFAKGCLKRNNVNVQSLPRECAVRFRDRTRERRVTLFTGRCLRQYGYRVARN
ncbi:hypothetical protein [Roseovarius sp. 2305UL8-3]|uniref:hypothetical protein n=1 Tax=Roseovarius conchicola TaxID=3121636 RepID=UPI003526FCC4